MLALFRLPTTQTRGAGRSPAAVVRDDDDEGKMVHKFSDRADEQRKKAEVVRLRTPQDFSGQGRAPAMRSHQTSDFRSGWPVRSVLPATRRPSVSFLLEPMAREFQCPAVLCDCTDHIVGCAGWNISLDLQRNRNLSTNLPGQMCDHLVGDPARVAADARGIELHGAVKSPGPLGCGRSGRRAGGLRL